VMWRNLWFLSYASKLEAKCSCYKKKIAGITVLITLFKCDKFVTVLLLKCEPRTWNIFSWVHKNAAYGVLQQNMSVVSCFHMITFIKLFIIIV
jgi:hypothetical protein